MNKNRLTTIEMPKALRDKLNIVKLKPLTKAEQSDTNKKAAYKAYTKQRATWCKPIGYPADKSGTSLLIALQACIKSGSALWLEKAKTLPATFTLEQAMACAPSLEDCVSHSVKSVETAYSKAMSDKGSYVAGLEEIVAFNKAVMADLAAGKITQEQALAAIAEGPTEDDDDETETAE